MSEIKIKLGSLFDGSGGFPLAGAMNGIEPVWASEIEPFPIRVTKLRFPGMKHLGSVTDIDGGKVEPVDIITFGSPCQDLSVAGKQKGIHEGERSNLFFEAIRIIKEMREHDKAIGRPDELLRPRFAVWENVPGAFSSNGGEDFRAVLQAFADVEGSDVSIPQPPKGKWKHAGTVVGNGWSVAWRVYDAQFWRTAQRRKRIYLIADFGGERAGEILFKPESLSWDSEQGGKAWKTASGYAERSFTGSDPAGFKGMQGALGGSIGYEEEKSPTLLAGQEAHVVYCLQGNGIDRSDNAGCNGKGWAENVSYTLNTIDRPAVCFQQNQRDEVRSLGKKTGALTANPGMKGQNYIAYPIENHPNDSRVRLQDPDTPVQTLSSRMGTGGGNVPMVLEVTGDPVIAFTQGDYMECRTDGKTSTLLARDYKQAQAVAICKSNRKYIVRRLTPLECCRLQGFPDWWTDGAGGSDSAIYKMWGNGIALPCAYDVLRRVAKELDDHEKL